MSRITKWLKRTKDQFERGKEPELNPNPLIQEGKLASLIALPLLAGLMAILYVAENFYITEMEFMLLTGAVFGMWICFLVVFYSMQVTRASQYYLFDREFGYTKRTHPRCECYCKPQHIALLLGPDEKIKKPEVLEERLTAFGFKKQIITEIKGMMKSKFEKYMYYFRHKDYFEGWDAEKHSVFLFRSHIVFMDEPFDKQFAFSEGQENWFGPILFNHPHAESDNVKVIGWSIDPFAGEPMPLCELVHSSIGYQANPDSNTDQKSLPLTEALFMMGARQHGIIESYRKEIKNRDEVIQAKTHGKLDIINLAKDSAKTDIKLWQLAMKEPSRWGWLKSTSAKVILGIVTIIAIVIIVLIVLDYIDISGLLG